MAPRELIRAEVPTPFTPLPWPNRNGALQIAMIPSSMSSPSKPPKAILFDIGGVVLKSPFQAILDYEIENKIPIGYINYAIQKGPHDTGAWQLIERGEVELNDDWFASFKRQLSREEVWSEYMQRLAQQESAAGGGQAVAGGGKPTAVPSMDAKKLFWRMMKLSRAPDPYMYPALRKLGQSGKFVLGAFSNNITFPPGIRDDEGELYTKQVIHPPAPNPYANDSGDITKCFDIFLGSAAVGVRKPDPKAYKLAVREMDEIAKQRGMGGVTAGETVFLDDIGINLKFAKKTGLRTIKVDLGKTRDAVLELEKAVGIPLLNDDKPRL
ncbi:HAD-superfamily hydrolase subfamily IA variant 3 [Pyrenophora seminiperda CCB06]|uniref:HAD-superfamily hydrolase subfamily IA variant 3 n=1 Tax=Pyrenophora seminiperda CCB06 TaxID=1302712 RepID=A0A3M7M8C0_9PLEO|nr:HAD-superfamily hydrolase subfamily IA variant 3 [Pyrenophora seminiperda CCB06]